MDEQVMTTLEQMKVDFLWIRKLHLNKEEEYLAIMASFAVNDLINKIKENEGKEEQDGVARLPYGAVAPLKGE